MPRDEVVAFLEHYAMGFEAPVREGVEVTSLEPGQEGRFRLETSAGEMSAGTVALCYRCVPATALACGSRHVAR